MKRVAEIPYIKLINGIAMPAFGFGTWHLSDGSEAVDSTAEALRAGYRLIDTARIYGNEKSIGEAVRHSGLDREQIFITTKLWPGDLGFDSAKRAFEDSLERLGSDYIDLYLIHWPGNNSQLRKQSWAALSDLCEEGDLRAAGVSNFDIDEIEELLSDSNLVPTVNQIELHPYNYAEQQPVIEYCQDKGIVIEAYSPLARGRNLDNQLLSDIADKYERSNAQVMLRWAIQHGTVPIPKSATPGRIRSNIEVFDFKLEQEDMKKLNALSRG